MLNNIIADLKNLEGQEVGRNSYFHQIYTNETRLDEISTLNVLENLKPYEVENFKVYDFEIDEECKVYFEDYLDFYEYEEIKSDNTYNWLSPLTNHINYRIYKSELLDNIIVELRVHRYGDVRCNYSEYAYLEFNDDYEFYEVLTESNKYFTIEKNGIQYDITIDIFNECPSIEVTNEDYEVKYLEGSEALELMGKLI